VIVVDTNVLAAFCLVSPNAETARGLWRVDSNWHAPHLWVSEFRNVLLLYYRQGIADESTCAAALAEAHEVIPVAHRHTPADDDVLALAMSSGCSAYDCEFVAVAEQLDLPLLTWDKRILSGFPERAVSPEAFVAGQED
jgi:predicted nucleic acid-binding protein